MSADEAIQKYVKNNDLLFFGGFGHLYPYSLIHEVIRKGVKNLTLVKHSPEIAGDQLIGAGCVKKIIFSWYGNPGIGSAHAFRRAIEKGIPLPIEIEEYTHFALSLMLKAGAMHIPFIPSKALFGSDLTKYNSKIKYIESFYK